jgi:hypothetical protein
MGGFRSFLILATGVAIGGALVIAHRISQDSGKSLPEAFVDVPSEAQRIFDDLRVRATEAMDRAREAYDQKQTELDAHLSGGPAE